MQKAALLFTGQGAQCVGMGRDVVAQSPAARAIYDRATDVLGFDIAEACFEGPAERLEQTDIQQPAIFVTGAAIWAAYRETGASIEQFSFAAGLSLGEYTALYAAGAISFDDAVRLVRLRGELMQAAAQAVPSGMVSVIGGDEETVRQLCAAVSDGEILAPANFNCPGQIVIAGTKPACERAIERAGEFGVKAVPLAVAGAFHTPLMQSAAEGLAPVLSSTRFYASKIPVMSNVTAQPHGQAPEAIRGALRQQITHPVLWEKCVLQMMAAGVNRFVEIGPGRVLTGLMRKISREATCTNLSTADSLQAGFALSGSADRP